MIEILPKDRWPELEEIFRREFDSYLPNDKSDILADIDENGNITGFVVLEFMCRIGQIYNTGTSSREMLEFFNKQIPHGNTVIAIASEPRFEGICQKFGMYRVDGTVYRKDF